MPLARLVRATADPAGDAELLLRFVDRRDEDAFAELVRRHGPLVRGVCRRMLGAADADDAAQAVFLTLARNAGRVRHADRLAGFLHGVSVRVCRKALARRRASGGVEPRRPAADPADEASWREVAAAVDEALARLPVRLRQPLVLCYLEELTRDEAAARLGWPVATLRGRLDRGRAKLRADLARRGFGLPAGLLAVLLSAPRGDAGWAANVTRILFDPAGPPVAVTALTVGVGWNMTTRLALGVALMLGLAGGLTAVGGRPPADPPKAEPVPPSKAASPAAPPGKPATPELLSLVGTWEAVTPAEVDGPMGNGMQPRIRRTIRRTFSADGTMVLRRIETGDNPRLYAARGTYTQRGQEITCHTLEAWVNDVPTPVFDTYPVYRQTVTWGKADGRPVLYLSDGNSRTRYVPVAAETLDAGVAPELARLDRRPPATEPAYRGKPVYLELTFGPNADLRTWLAVDGDRAYLDRNANGDLTDDGGPVIGVLVPPPPPVTPPQARKGEAPQPPVKQPTVHTFALGTVTHATRGRTYSDLDLTVTATTDEAAYGELRLRVNADHWEAAGTGTLLLAARPIGARRLHFDADRLVVQPTPNPDRLVVLLDEWSTRQQPTVEIHAQVGTPGVGRDTFVARSLDGLPGDKRPLAVLAAGNRKGTTLPVGELQTDRHGLWTVVVWPLGGDQFSKGSEGVTVTLSFPDYPSGKIEPTTYKLSRRKQ